jgi:hypothetical protein
MDAFWFVAHCSLVEVYRRFRGILIFLMMEAENTTKTSVNLYQTTQCNNPEEAVVILTAVRT